MNFGREIMDFGHEVSDEEEEFNSNTLETMSAKSFGSFVRPGPRMREEDLNKRLQRHQSFFSPSDKSPRITARSNGGQSVRRAESFNYKSKPNTPDNFESFSRHDHGKRKSKSTLQKSKSMEFLKAKLLPRKATKSPDQQQCNNNRSNGMAPRNHKQSTSCVHLVNPIQKSSSSKSVEAKADYDWRQDTPFWNKRGGKRGVTPKAGTNRKQLDEVIGPWQNVHIAAQQIRPDPWSPQRAMIPPFMFGGPRKNPLPPPAFTQRTSMYSAGTSPHYLYPNYLAPFSPHNSFVHHGYHPQSLTPPVTPFPGPMSKQYNHRPYSAMSTEKLSDRLEITELSDHEDEDYDKGYIAGSTSNVCRVSVSPPRRMPMGNITPKPYKSKHHGKGNIFDIPSGLY